MIAVLLWACSPEPPPPHEPPAGFWDHWGDGRAEVSGYTLLMPRHDELRVGEAVLNWVTEDFTTGQLVKAEQPHDDVFPVLKLVDMRDFQTGAYDFSLVTTTFERIDRPAEAPPVKVSFSWQDWCGHSYQQLTFREGRGQHVLHSYWDGEADQSGPLEVPEGGLLGDSVPLAVRGLLGFRLSPGESRTMPYLPTLSDQRMGPLPLAWGEATLQRSAETAPTPTALGIVEAETWTLSVDGGATTTYTVEASPPRRLLGWSRTTGEEARIAGSVRSDYWNRTQNGDADLRADLGLPVHVWPRAGPVQPPVDAAR